MKFTKILPLLPLVAMLTSCAQTEVKLPSDKDQLISEKQTEAPTDFVVYPDDRPSIPGGKVLYEKQNGADKQSCVACHGAGGVGGDGPKLNDNTMMSQKKPVDLYKFLTYGKGQHTALKGSLSNREIWDLVFYCKSLGTPPLTTADMDVLSPVFGSNCAVCHGVKGDGDGPLARNLEPNPANFQTFRRFYDREDSILYDHIANGIKFEGMPNFLGKEDRKKNFKFSPENIHKLVMYVRNFHVSNEGAVIAAAPAAGSSSKAAAAPPAAATATATSTAPPPSSTPTASGSPTSTPASGAPPDTKPSGGSPAPTAAGGAPPTGSATTTGTGTGNSAPATSTGTDTGAAKK